MTPRVKYLTAGQAADLLGVHRRTVSRWCEVGRLEGHRTAGGDRRGGQWRVHPGSVQNLLGKTKGAGHE